MLRIALITSDNKIQKWQNLALEKASRRYEIVLVANCNNSSYKKFFVKNFIYYFLNFIFYRGNLFKKIKINNLFKDILKIDFESKKNGNWEEIPQDILKIIEEKKVDLVFKFGMSLLKVPKKEISKYGFFSFHHGDSNYYRGRPACFYEFLNKEEKIGTIIQKLENNIDTGSIRAIIYSKIFHYSFQKTVNNVYFNSTLLLDIFLKNIKHQAHIKNSNGKLYKLPNNLLSLKFLILNYLYFLKKILFWSFFYNDWNIAILNESLFQNNNSINITINKTKKIERDKKYLFYSDPFFLNYNNILFEAYDISKSYGIINKYNIEEKSFCNILTLKDHTSFPNIFIDNDSKFILPEIGSWSAPKLFQLNKNDEKIIIEKKLKGFEDKKIIDSTIFLHNDIHYIFFGYKKNNLDVCNLYFSEDGKFGKYVEHPSSPIAATPIGARMAGSIVKYNKNLYRLGQNNINKYGNGVDIFKIQIINKIMYRETYYKSVRFTDAYGPHTIDCFEDRVVLDYYKIKFSLFSGLRRISNYFS